MVEHPTNQQAAHTRLALLIQLQETRTHQLAHVTGCLADPVFRATVAPDDLAMLRSHQAALEKIIVLIERQYTNTPTLPDTLERAHRHSSIPVRGLQRLLAWCWAGSSTSRA